MPAILSLTIAIVTFLLFVMLLMGLIFRGPRLRVKSKSGWIALTLITFALGITGSIFAIVSIALFLENL